LAEKEHRYRPVPRPWYRRSWFSWLVVLGILVVLLAILVLPVAAQDSVSYCTSCKSMKPAEATWAAGPHKDVSCTACHIPPGVEANARWRLREARNIWADYLSMPAGADRGHVPTNANCLQCHPLSKLPDETNGVRMNHELHLKLRGLTCADCHDTVSHKAPKTRAGVSMVTCTMCHNGQTAPNGCDYCHVAPPPSRHAPSFMQDHGKLALLNEADCLRCHHDKKSFCDKCHAVPPATHFSGQWRYTHSDAATKDPASCEACHDQAYCSQCHQVSHPTDWVQIHGPIAKKGPSACLVCHPQGMCDACHEQNGIVTP
jgi:nitrate/TMAO reductase-like tetraheme cytochrome c subunit